MGLGENVEGENVDWNGNLDPAMFEAVVTVGLGLAENEAGAKVDWNGLREGDGVGLGLGLGAKVD